MGIKNKEKFCKWVANWGKIFAPSCDSVEEDINEFRNGLRDGYNDCFPQKRCKLRKIDIEKPWGKSRKGIDSMLFASRGPIGLVTL